MQVSFDNLKDDIEAIYAPSKTVTKEAPSLASILYKQPCKKCDGKGHVIIGYVYQRLAQCFACKGKGILEFKTSPEHRARAKANTQARKDRAQKEIVARANEWRIANELEATWLDRAASRGFEFAVSLQDKLNKFGHLSDGQIAAVRRCIVRDDERKAEQEQRAVNAPTVSVEAIETAFANAKEAGIKWPRLRLDDFVFSPAGSNSNNAGAVYIKRGETYLGKVLNGRLFASRDCDDHTRDHIVALASDPHNAAIAYGKKFGKCSVCNRELSDPASIERGIGPICAGRYGW